MEFWPENQGQSPLYSKFGTVPGRNCTHNYHDRHQVSHYPLHYGEQQDQSRDSNYWIAPGSRTGEAPQEFTNWTDQELTAPTSSHFPFILDRHAQQHQDLGDYQQHEVRDREWTAAQRAAREYERGFLREAWQRRWEPCGPVRYNRDVSAKKSDSSYRELEAWAARYSYSLPRRRRIEAELRGASQGLLEGSRAPERDNRSGDPRVAALQQVRQSANIRQSGLWDRGGRQQAPTYYPPQTPATHTSRTLDKKEKANYQQRMFSQPPGYIAPPPYDGPHKGSPVLHHCDTSWEQEGKEKTYWSKPALREQDVSVDVQDHREGEKEEFTKPDGNQKDFPDLEGLKHRRHETDVLQAGGPSIIQETRIEQEGILPLQHQQVLPTVEDKKINEEPASKVIEGRKFRLNKKTGGMTIFCLVSRIAGTTETPSLPLCTSQTNIQNTELGVNQTHKLADEVDFRAPSLTDQSNTSTTKEETPTCIKSELLEDDPSNKAETDVPPQKVNTNDADSTFGRQALSVKYPLWKQPSFTTRAETESSSTCVKANSEEGESDVLYSQESKVHPIDIEVRRLDIKTDTEDSNGLLVIDTTCVVVKMELLPSPKKEHVHYLHTEQSLLDVQSAISPVCVQSNSQLDQDATTEQNRKTSPFHVNEIETKLDSEFTEKKAPEVESEISSLCRETLQERAERILGIPLYDCITKQQPEEATILLDLCVEEQMVEPSPLKDTDDGVEEIPEDTREEEDSQNQLEVGQTEDAECLQENDDANDPMASIDGGDLGLQDQISNMSEENDIGPQVETDIKPSPEIEMTEDRLHTSTSEEGTTEQEEDDTSSHDPSQCLSPITSPSDLDLLSPSPDCDASDPALSLMLSSSNLMPLMHISESNTEEGSEAELTALNSAENPEISSLPNTPSPLPPGSTDSTTSSTPYTYNPPSPSPLDLMDHSAEAISGVEDPYEAGEPQLINNDASDVLEDIAENTTEELESQQYFESGQPDDAASVKESNVTDEQQTEEVDKDLTDHTMEQTLEISKENAIELDVCVKAEDVAHVKECDTSEEQLPEEVNEDPTGLLTEALSQEDVTASRTQTNVNILHQQFDNGQEEAASVGSYMAEEQSQEEADDDPTGLLEQTLSIEDVTDSQTQTEVNILHNPNAQEDAASVGSYMAEEQSEEEADDDPTGLLEQTLSIEDVTDSQTQTEVNILHIPNAQEEAASVGSYMAEEQSEEEADDDPTGLMEQTLFIENVTDSQTHIDINILQDIEPQAEPSNSSPPSPSDSDCIVSESCLAVHSSSELPSPPHTPNGSDAEFAPLLHMDSECISPLVCPAAGITETVPPPLHLDSCEEYLQFSSSSCTDSPPVLPSSSSTPLLQQGSKSVDPDSHLKGEPQYPKSLWDAVNRIRKHTAPDSENEEEEVSELWDPESVAEDMGCPDAIVGMNSDKTDFGGTGHQVSTEKSVEDDIEVGEIQEGLCHEEPRGLAEEDTLSCSSTCSHDSGDTVIVAEEDEVEETPPDAGTESKTGIEEERETAERECCSAQVNDEAAAEEEGDSDGDKCVTNECRQIEHNPVEAENITTEAVETTETELERIEEVEGFSCPQIKG